MRDAIECLDTYKRNPENCLTAKDIFKCSVDDAQYKTLISNTNDEVLSLFSLISGTIKIVLERQMALYLKDEPCEAEKQNLLSAPLHNLTAERIMEMLDAYHKKASNATTLYTEALIKSRANNTIRWLANNPRKEKLISFSLGKGRLRRKMSVDDQRKIEDIVIDHTKTKMDEMGNKMSKAIGKRMARLIKGMLHLNDCIVICSVKIFKGFIVLLLSLVIMKCYQ